ncbi:PREDICTED: DNA topoisomerase 2-alpha-like [Gekko japonicus]|uniref:DNA topoisomerase 2-alpha-like n=1 Tax=Gekko japonicus TaxID=146911 RepID=A0ABM1JU01_GEKJA|nr:PREDICTED: DNA topoisomerase 2-alpha-like [Gekko japonicus]
MEEPPSASQSAVDVNRPTSKPSTSKARSSASIPAKTKTKASSKQKPAKKATTKPVKAAKTGREVPLLPSVWPVVSIPEPQIPPQISPAHVLGSPVHQTRRPDFPDIDTAELISHQMGAEFSPAPSNSSASILSEAPDIEQHRHRFAFSNTELHPPSPYAQPIDIDTTGYRDDSHRRTIVSSPRRPRTRSRSPRAYRGPPPPMSWDERQMRYFCATYVFGPTTGSKITMAKTINAKIRPHIVPDISFLPKVVLEFHLQAEVFLPDFFPNPTSAEDRLLHNLDVKRALLFYLQRTRSTRRDPHLFVSTLARLVFPPVDDNVLNFLYDDNRRVEPEWYIPILPMVLINGAEGIGTGWSCKVPNYDVREVVNNLRRMLDGEEPLPMHPSYKNFKGTIDELGEKQYLVNGEVSILDSTTIEISELPVRTWTQVHKEQVLEPMLGGTEKSPPLITDYKEYHTDTTVKFIVKMSEQKLAEAEAAGLHKVFKLQTSLSCTNMVLFDHVGCLKKYETAEDILREFYELRLRYYGLRKDWLAGLLGAESAKLSNQARFILEKIGGIIVIENKPKKEIIKVLIERGYESDPLKSWKESQQKDTNEEKEDDEESGKENESTAGTGPDFNYLLNMPLWYLTKEKKDELCKQRDDKEVELKNLKRKNPDDLWKEDLAAFVEALEELEAKEKEDEMLGAAGRPIKGKGGKLKVKKLQLTEVMPSPHGRRVVPRVTEEMKMDATKKLKRKIKTEKPDLVGDQGESPESDKEPGALKQRLAKKIKVETGTKKQSVLPFKPVKKAKRNPWSDSESEEDNRDSDSEAQEETDEDAVAKKNLKSPAAKLKVASKKAMEKQAKKQQTQVTKVQSSIPTEIPDSDDKPDASASSLPPIGPGGKLAPRKRGPAKKARSTAEENQPTIVDAFAKEEANVKPRKSGAAVSSESGTDKTASKKPAVARAKKATKRRPAFSSSEDSDADLQFVKKSTALKKSKAADESFSIDLGSDDDLPAAPIHCQRPGRARKPVQYLEESEDEI